MATFRTRARTVDMLGRQQIASVSTAISEVFKNASDAYATQVRVDLLVDRRCLLFRDDGIGMSGEEFENNWLTLATDTKTTGQAIRPPKGMDLRPVLGAKGIGRLAIAVVGPHSLVLTRSRRGGSDLVYAFVNWTLFAEPGVDLDEVEVPLARLAGGELPTSTDVQRLVDESRSNIEAVVPSQRAESLVCDLEKFDVDAVGLLDQLDGPSLKTNGHGAQFVISPVDDEALAEAADNTRDAGLTINLVGFADTMTPGHPVPGLAASLWVHSGLDTGPVDVLAASEFLTEEEFWAADHQITGSFDDHGTFQGEVRVYGGRPQPYELRWKDSPGTTSRCGPFRFAMAVTQPKASESRMPPRDHARLDEKLRRMGGIYVYRHGIRVLPYGRPDVDWLDIEERRTKRLGTAFYSHRRLFGAVIITNEDNKQLQEKAGREGFQQNLGYRQLRSILRQFLRASATDFFVKGGAHSESYLDKKDSAKRKAKARKEKQARVKGGRAALADSISKAYVALTDGDAQARVAEILHSFRQTADRVQAGDNPNPMDVELYQAVAQLRDLENTLRVDIPPDLGLTRELKRDLGSLHAAYEDFEGGVLAPARQELEVIASNLFSELSRPTTSQVVAASRNRSQRVLESAEKDLAVSVEDLAKRGESLLREVAEVVSRGVDDLVARDLLAAELAPEEHVVARMQIEHDVDGLYEAATEVVAGFTATVGEVRWVRDGDSIITSADAAAALDEELAELRDNADESLDLVQLGMTLSILDHEFQLIIRSLRQSLRQLRGWSDVNPTLTPLADDLELSFEHLDSYLTLFTPLQRRLNKRRTVITGDDIHRFLAGLFDPRLDEADVELRATDAFLEQEVKGFRSTWYPVFVNLVDNALYWAGEGAPPRVIRLDVSASSLVVADTGRGVADEDRELIFAPQFSLKPGGRGLGLTISREVLEREGYGLDVDTDEQLGGAAFIIRRNEEPSKNDD